MAQTEDELKAALARDPGGAAFVLLAEILIRDGRFTEALPVLLAGLSHNESSDVGRLLLAETFYHLNYLPFAAREVSELSTRVPQSESLRKLLALISPQATEKAEKEEEGTVAETEFDFEDIDLLDDKKN